MSSARDSVYDATQAPNGVPFSERTLKSGNDHGDAGLLVASASQTSTSCSSTASPASDSRSGFVAERGLTMRTDADSLGQHDRQAPQPTGPHSPSESPEAADDPRDESATRTQSETNGKQHKTSKVGKKKRSCRPAKIDTKQADLDRTGSGGSSGLSDSCTGPQPLRDEEQHLLSPGSRTVVTSHDAHQADLYPERHFFPSRANNPRTDQPRTGLSWVVVTLLVVVLLGLLGVVLAFSVMAATRGSVEGPTVWRTRRG